jgi:serine/threonine protein kinase
MKLKRPQLIAALFNEHVMYTINDQSEYIPQLNQLKEDLKDKRMQEAFKKSINDYYDSNPDTKSFARMKKMRPDRPYSILMVSDEPFLILPTPPEWKKLKENGKSLSNAAPKTLVSLATGELKFLKTLRSNFAGDTYPARKARKEYETLKRWGEDVAYLERDTPKGKKCYLLMDHYGLSMDNPILAKNITASNIFHALIQAADNLKKIHDAGELHLDVKPSNIMYGLDIDKAKLIDAEEVQPDQSVLDSAPGTLLYMHPDRFTYVNGLRVPKTGSIRVCKGDDIFAFLLTIENILAIAIDREYNASCKTFLKETLKQFKDKAYTQYAADGSGTHAQKMRDLPTLETIQGMLTGAMKQYFKLELADQAKFLDPQPEKQDQAVIPPASKIIVAKPQAQYQQAPAPKPAPVQSKPQYQQAPAPKPAPVQPKPQYQQAPAPKPAPVQPKPQYQQAPAPKPAPVQPKLHHQQAPVQYKQSAPAPVPMYQPMYQVSPPPQAQLQQPSPKLTSHGLNFHYQANNLSPRYQNQQQGFPNSPSPRLNYQQQGFPNSPSPRLNYQQYGFANNPSPRCSDQQQGYLPSPKLERRENLQNDVSPRLPGHHRVKF